MTMALPGEEMMTDITQHDWCDTSLASAAGSNGHVIVGHKSGAGFLEFDQRDARALAEHFGLLPRRMTREEFEQSPATGPAWIFYGAGVDRRWVLSHIVVLRPDPLRIEYGYIGGGNNSDWPAKYITHVMPIPVPEPPK